MSQKIITSYTGTLGSDATLQEQSGVVGLVLGQAIAEAIELAGDEQQLVGVEFELGDSINFHHGHLGGQPFTVQIVTRMR